jgi:hypothetical protein
MKIVIYTKDYRRKASPRYGGHGEEFQIFTQQSAAGAPRWGQQEPLYIQAENGTSPCIMSKYGSEEFLFHYYEIQDAGRMKEGDRACPPIPPLLMAMMTYYQFRVYRIRGRKTS